MITFDELRSKQIVYWVIASWLIYVALWAMFTLMFSFMRSINSSQLQFVVAIMFGNFALTIIGFVIGAAIDLRPR